jgi:hypothetical protein
MGHDVDSLAKSDPSIAIAINQFSAKYPNWEKKLNEGLRYKVRSAGGVSTAQFKKGKLQLRSEKLEDDSLIQSTELARKSVENMLRRSGYEGAPLNSALENFDNVPDDQRTEIALGLEIIKWRITGIKPDLSNPVTNPIIPIKIAYEFLACHVGDEIYSVGREFCVIRNALKSFDVDKDEIQVQYMQSNRNDPIHGIVVEESPPYVKIQIRLFGTIAYRVHFKRLAFSGPRFVYTHELHTNREAIREVPTELRKKRS